MWQYASMGMRLERGKVKRALTLQGFDMQMTIVKREDDDFPADSIVLISSRPLMQTNIHPKSFCFCRKPEAR
ncbi:hypothetical protein ABE28_012255 [Peribacillus muralis]|uniref:Uncharacterized protein n=1 Tax=Peribacillus muralis TaxID=264697 RepID=A0A1B3XPH5_9BACI|nr:hypothetical protein ABE28_012255 [Peribacillus muralis]